MQYAARPRVANQIMYLKGLHVNGLRLVSSAVALPEELHWNMPGSRPLVNIPSTVIFVEQLGEENLNTIGFLKLVPKMAIALDARRKVVRRMVMT